MAVTRLPRDRRDILTFMEVCAELRMHYNTGYRLRREGRFPIHVEKLGRRYFCRRVDLEEYLHGARRAG
jgi:hypothetical protein